MASSSDTTAPFLRIPWTRALLSRPNLITRVPDSRSLKSTNEDSLFATTLKTPTTIRDCITVYPRPEPSDSHINEITTLATLGSALDGHPGILHGGIVASLLDEAMGILQTVNHERDHFLAVGRGVAEGESPANGLGSFTAFLDVTYERPVRSGAAVQVVARYVKREGRKQWIDAEVRQVLVGGGEDEDGEVVVCARGSGLFVVPRGSRI
jgi:acyl-coenzyme A thioesterase PaaI-like protein